MHSGIAAQAEIAKQAADQNLTKTQTAMLSDDEKRIRAQHEALHDTQGALASEHEKAEKARQETQQEHAARMAAGAKGAGPRWTR